MSRVAFALVLAWSAAGCFNALPADGSLRCNMQSTKVCPGGFYCADDGACWRLGHSPSGDGGAGEDMSVGGNDLSGLPSTCTVDTCAGNVLRVCNTAGMFEDQTCSLGCSSTGAPHCASVVPQSPILPADLNASGLVPVVLAATTTVHGDTGAIDGIRSANVSATTREINNGIAFHIANGVSIFSFASLKVDDAIVVHLVGPNAIALVAAADVELIGQIEARSCPSGGVGGAAPATGGQSGTGQGFGTVGSQVNTSGGGAGHGDKGGHGANDMAVANEAAGGAIYGTASLNPLSGGSSGAGGSFAGSVPVGGRGGAGGGALQLVAAGKVVLGGGNQPGGVNAGGCGGGQGAGGGATGSGGGGGGSGGAILVEAAAIEIRSNGGLAANGGGGGSQGGSGSPQYNGAMRRCRRCERRAASTAADAAVRPARHSASHMISSPIVAVAVAVPDGSG